MRNIFILLLSVSFLFTSCAKYAEFQKKMNALTVENIDITLVKDGTYEGTCDMDLVSAKVKVEVLQGKITSIELLEHKHGPGYGAAEIKDSIIQKQSLEVDSKTGATGSSRVIRKAVEEALKKGI